VVIAIEVDPRFARDLRSMFAGDPAVRIVEGDARSWPLPREPFRAFGNVPFAITTDLLRRLLDDEACAMTRADLIVQRETARKRVADPPRTVLSLSWGPWWTFAIERHLPHAASVRLPGSTPRSWSSGAENDRCCRSARDPSIDAWSRCSS
jgi:23S rRNA (adenine-N6)-dimethyltransferase